MDIEGLSLCLVLSSPLSRSSIDDTDAVLFELLPLISELVMQDHHSHFNVC